MTASTIRNGSSPAWVAASAAFSLMGIEDDEADLVLGNVDRSAEADANTGPRQLVRRGTGTPLSSGAFSGAAAREERFDEVARHAFDARQRAPR